VNPITIWGRISSINVRKPVLAAQWLGLAFTRIDAGKEFGKLNTPEYSAMNPNRLIPVLQHGSYTLWESNAIVRYLCASSPERGYYPENLQLRFDAERWMDWQQTTLNRASGPAFVQWIRTAPKQRNADVIAQSCTATKPLLDMLEAHLASSAFMVGNTLTMADFPIACEVHRWFNLPQPESDLAAYPAIARWYAQLHPQPASAGVLDLPLE
jgi:glutathione S-transferase